MAKNKHSRDEDWARAKKLCRLNARQVEMAKRLGMNPKKLPKLIPSPSQRWKAPVGVFIEECHAKSFGGDPAPHEHDRDELDAPGDGFADANDVRWAIGQVTRMVADLAILAAFEEIEPEDRLVFAGDLRHLADRIERGTEERCEPEPEPTVRDDEAASRGPVDYGDIPF